MTFDVVVGSIPHLPGGRPSSSEEEEHPRQPGEPCHHDVFWFKEYPKWEHTCDKFECRAEVWTGPEGLKPDDLRYSVIICVSREWKVGDRWGRPDKVKGVTWKYNRRESEGDGWTDFVYGAAMDYPAFLELMEGFEGGSESGGMVGPTEAEDHWAPSVVYDSDWNERLFVTAWPKVRMAFSNDVHLFDEWDDICLLLIGKPAWGAKKKGKDDGQDSNTATGPESNALGISDAVPDKG